MAKHPNPVDDARPTLAEVARVAGVSEITASRALRGGAHVARATLERVQDAARALRYTPNRLAGTLAGGQSRQVAVVLPSLSNSVFADVLHGLETRLEQAGHHPILGVSNYDPTHEERLIADLLSWRPAGLVLAPAISTAETRRMLVASGVPVVEIMDVDPVPIDTAVGLSQRAAGRALAHFLLGRGYRRLAYAGHDISTDPRALSRLQGLRDGLAEAGVTLVATLLLPGPSSVPLGREAVARLLQDHPVGGGADRLAVCFSNDDVAVGGMFQALAAGLDVPRDLALAGFNGLAIGQALPLPLTTIASRRVEIGEMAGDALLARVQGLPVERVQDVGFRLVLGATT
ncbi:MAG: LacI family DNA-binding transcriptional regulator [Rhodobacteraceae bacterium]|jgi:LacI family gluconate utilization system Gnt-I transcriptional repressor|nr:LacI family DNA-binding transcriptional regulator [Paracoccaceae bacterium]